MKQGISIDKLPELKNPFFIAGFDGWGNALDISRGMVTYLVRKLGAEQFARVNPDLFYRYDEDRPLVTIKDGMLRGISPPGGSFYAYRGVENERDLVILKANEPSLQWLHFVDELFSLCENIGVKTVVTLGSMYDSVIHSDRIISGIASNKKLLESLKKKNVIPINYQGPSAIHSILHSVGKKRGFECLSLWCHCPYYLEGTTHFGLLSHLGALLSDLGGFKLDMAEIEASWKELNGQIQRLINKNPQLQAMIRELRKAKVRGSWESMKEDLKKGEKVIHLENFLRPK
jgi:proteasome assembly chaperone (PAC2) family protein